MQAGRTEADTAALLQTWATLPEAAQLCTIAVDFIQESEPLAALSDIEECVMYLREEYASASQLIASAFKLHCTLSGWGNVVWSLAPVFLCAQALPGWRDS